MPLRNTTFPVSDLKMARSFLAQAMLLAAVVATLVPLVAGNDFFYNDVSGKSQWEEPSDPVAHEDEEGRKYWFDSAKGESTWEFPGIWAEVASEEHGQNYYFNKETEEAVWEKPEAMGWRRVSSEDAASP